MDIKSVLDERVIDLRMKAKDKKEAITYLAGKLKDAGYIADVEEYVKNHQRALPGAHPHVDFPKGDNGGGNTHPHHGIAAAKQ